MNKKIKLAIFSSANDKVSPKLEKKIDKIARYLFSKNIILVTGGSTGVPAGIVETFVELGGQAVMFSPDKTPESHSERFDNHSLEFYHETIFGKGFTARSLEMINFVDGALVLNGRTGTLSEFTIAVEEGLPVSVITRTGGISDYLKKITRIVKKQFPSKVFFGRNYKKQIDLLMECIKKQQ